MPQWEYQYIEVDNNTVKRVNSGTKFFAPLISSYLNDIGEEGWEVVSATKPGGAIDLVIIAKRQKR